MKFTVKQSDLRNALSKVMPAIPPKSTLPVLEHILTTVVGTNLKLITTDQDITIEYNIPIESGEDGSILIPARKFNDNIKQLPSSEVVSFDINLSNFEIKGKTADKNFQMKGLNADEYPEISELDQSIKPNFVDGEFIGEYSGQTPSLIEKDEIIRLCSKTSFAVSNDEFRPAMTGVFFQFRGEYVNAVATDSYRLVKATYTPEKSYLPENLDLIIPLKTIDLLKNADSDLIISYIYSGNKITHLRFDIENMVYISRLIDEKFPPYESVIPSNNQLKVTVDKNLLISAIKFVSISSSSISKQIKVVLDNNTLTIIGQDEDSGTEAKQVIQCDYSADLIEIGFNYKFLEDAVSNCDSEEDNSVVLTLSEPTRPALILPSESDKKLLMLIMPVRIS